MPHGSLARVLTLERRILTLGRRILTLGRRILTLGRHILTLGASHTDPGEVVVGLVVSPHAVVDHLQLLCRVQVQPGQLGHATVHLWWGERGGVLEGERERGRGG